uniref:MULE transposase domain-containing protein n=1 Tax=Plectus sambesii TaxID=2011161 RepID=A0A914WV65_9BILA
MYKVEWTDPKSRKENAPLVAVFFFDDFAHTFCFRKKSSDQSVSYFTCIGCENSRNGLRQAVKKAKEGESPAKRPHVMKWIHVGADDNIVNGDPRIGHDVDCAVKSRTEVHVQKHKRIAAQKVFKGEMTTTDARVKAHSAMTTSCAENNVVEDDARALWKHESIKSLLRKTRASRLPTIVDPLVIPDEYKLTMTNQRFQLEVDSENMVVFADDRGLGLMRRSPVWKLDGTFRTAPRGFYQVYTIHCRHPDFNESIVVLHAFMKRRLKTNYAELFELVRRSLGPEPLTDLTPGGVRRRALFDYEPGTNDAFSTVFPEFVIKGCRFHFAQKILGHFDDNLKVLKRENEDISHWLKQVLALPLLPAELVPTVWDESLRDPPAVEAKYAAHLKKYVEYVEENWIHCNARPIALWNHYDNDMCRTTNSAEGWHSGILSSLRGKHPSMSEYLEWLRGIHDENVTRLVQLDRGISTRRRRTEYIELDKKIVEAKRRLAEKIDEEGRKGEPDYVTVFVTYLTHVSFLFGHGTFYNPKLIDANLADLPSPSSDDPDAPCTSALAVDRTGRSVAALRVSSVSSRAPPTRTPAVLRTLPPSTSDDRDVPSTSYVCRPLSAPGVAALRAPSVSSLSSPTRSPAAPPSLRPSTSRSSLTAAGAVASTRVASFFTRVLLARPSIARTSIAPTLSASSSIASSSTARPSTAPVLTVSSCIASSSTAAPSTAPVLAASLSSVGLSTAGPSTAALTADASTTDPSTAVNQWTEADEARYQATSRILDDAARPDTPPAPRLTRQELREQLWPLYNIAISEECRQHLLSIRYGDVHSLRAEDFDLAAPIGELNCGPFLADTELTEHLHRILLDWLKEEVDETNDGMMRHHQYNYATGVWVPEAVAFALQQQNPDMTADEIYNMVNEPPAEYLEEEMVEVRGAMLAPSSRKLSSASRTQMNIGAPSTSAAAVTVQPAPVLPIAQGATAAGPEAKKSTTTTTRETCRPYAEPAARREDDDDEDDQPRDFRRSGSKRKSARCIGESRLRDSIKRTKTSQLQSTSKSALQLVSSFASVFNRMREAKKEAKREETKSAIEYLSQFDQKSLDMVQAYMSRHKTTRVKVNDNPVKAAKTMKKIQASEDTYEKAVDCYISTQPGGMFGLATREKANELFAIEAAQRRSERSSFRRHDSRRSLREKKKKNKWITIEDDRDRDIERQLAQMEADRNETDSRLNQHRQSTYSKNWLQATELVARINIRRTIERAASSTVQEVSEF